MAIIIPQSPPHLVTLYEAATKILKPAALKIWTQLIMECPPTGVKAISWFSPQGIVDKFDISITTAKRAIKELQDTGCVEFDEQNKLYCFIPGGKQWQMTE